MSGVENLALANVNATTFSAKNTSDLTTIKITGGATAKATVVNLGSSDITVSSTGNTDTNAGVTLDNSGAVTVNMDAPSKNKAAEGTSDTALGDSYSAQASVTAINAQDVTVNIGEGVKATGTIEADKATAMTLNVDTLLNKADTPTEQTAFEGTINAAKVTDLQINAEGQVKIDGASSLSSLESLTLKAGDSADLSSLNLSKVASVELSGSNKESSVKLGDIGSNSADYDVSISASGLKDGLTMGNLESLQNLEVSANGVTGDTSIADGKTIQAANVTLNASNVAGELKIGGVDAKTAESGSAIINTHDNTKAVTIGDIGGANSFKTVSVDASANTKAVKVGNVTATDSASVKFANNLDTSEVGKISAKNVTVDASNTLKTVTVGEITAVSSATLKAGLEAINETNNGTTTINVENSASDATFTANINGSIKEDTINITVVNDAESSVTVKGDLDVQPADKKDTVTVDASAVTSNTNKVTVNLSSLDGYEKSEIKGGAGVNVITGGAGKDTITVSDTNDKDDVIKAGAGDDVITSYKGNDTITGGAGSDTFDISTNNKIDEGVNHITDFDFAEDKLKTGTDGAAKLDLTSVDTSKDAAGNAITNLVDAAGVVFAHDSDNDGTSDVEAAGAGAVVLFKYDSSTYLAQNTAADGSFDDGTDFIVDITGYNGALDEGAVTA